MQIEQILHADAQQAKEGGRCPKCGGTVYLPGKYCPRCGRDRP